MKLKKLSILGLTLLALATTSQTHASVFSKAKDKWNDATEEVKEFYDNKLKEHVDAGIDATTDCYKNNLKTHVDAAADKADNLREKIKDKLFSSKSSTVVLNVEQFRNDVKLFYHYSQFAINIWEIKKDALSMPEPSMNSLLEGIAHTKTALTQIANNPQNTYLTPELINEYQPTPDQVDPNNICSVNSPICDDSLNDTFNTALQKIGFFYTQYHELVSEIVLI